MDSTFGGGWRRRRGGAVLVAALGVVLAVAVAAAASAAPQTGSFKATGAVRFTFRITKGRCDGAPKNLSNPNAKRGKAAEGFCFSSASTPTVHLSCVTGEAAAIDEMSGLRLSSSGTLHVRAYSYYGGNISAGFTELDLKVRGASASGFVRVSWVDAAGSPSCETGELAFTAKRR
jgi:hypothetical protein